MHFGRYDAAKDDLLKAVELDSNNTTARGNLRKCLEQLYGETVTTQDVTGDVLQCVTGLDWTGA